MGVRLIYLYGNQKLGKTRSSHLGSLISVICAVDFYGECLVFGWDRVNFPPSSCCVLDLL